MATSTVLLSDPAGISDPPGISRVDRVIIVGLYALAMAQLFLAFSLS